MHSVSLTAREDVHLLLLMRPLGVAGADIDSRLRGALAEVDHYLAAADLIRRRAVRVQAVARLVDVAEPDGVADAEFAAIGRVLAGDHAEQRRLAGAVRADDADDAAWRQLERQLIDQQVVAV